MASRLRGCIAVWICVSFSKPVAGILAALKQPSARRVGVIKAIAFALCLLPLARLIVAGLADWRSPELSEWLATRLTLGVNPIELITRSTGTWTLALVLITLAVTPVRRLFGWGWIVELRRMLGLFAFSYALIHLITYLWLDQFFDWGEIVKDIVKRPFITVGFAAFVVLTPLALTSTDRMVHRIGSRRWLMLHRGAYAAGILGVVHYWWLVKRDLTQPVLYAVVLGLLLAFRLLSRRHETRRRVAPSQS